MKDKLPKWTRKQWLTACLCCLALMLVALSGCLLAMPVDLPTRAAHGAGITIYDRDDKAVSTVHKDEDRLPVALDKIAPAMRNAVIAAEDKNFYAHRGIDLTGIARALTRDVQAGKMVEGGSTITQQLVRNLYLNPKERTLRRKLREVVLALSVEMKYSKDKILETYLNEVYFGRGAYGIERAASAYFNKHASQLTLGESAYLAAVVPAPSEMGAPESLASTKRRAHEIIDQMVALGMTDKDKGQAAKGQALVFHKGPHPYKYPYYVSWIIDTLKADMGAERLWKENLRVYTHLDPVSQKQAEIALARGVTKAPRGATQGALVSLSVADGAVRALVGGVGDYESHQFNRAVAPHTMGSAFKPFVYLAALVNNNIGPESMVNDAPIVMRDPVTHVEYRPKNYDGEFYGWMSVREALVRSRNVCAVEVADATGIEKVISTARAAGINATMDPYLSLALGACAVSPLETANAYATLARSGVHMAASGIRRVETASGQVLKIYKPDPEQVFPPEPVYQLVDVMQDVVENGTGRRARLPGVAVAGKTGTSDQARDLWFVGFTPDLVTALWIGNDKNQPVSGGRATGGAVPARIFHDYMVSLPNDRVIALASFTAPAMPLSHRGEALSIPFAVPRFVEQFLPRTVHEAEEMDEDYGPRKKKKKNFWKRVFAGMRDFWE